MKKRFLNILLAGVMLISLLMPAGASAQGFTEVILKGETSCARPGDQIKIMLSLDGGELKSIDAAISYDPAFFSYVDGSGAYSKEISSNASHMKISEQKKGSINIFLQVNDTIPADGSTVFTFELLVLGESGTSSKVTAQNVIVVCEGASSTPRVHPVTITASSSAAQRTQTPVRTPTPFDPFAPPPYTPGLTPEGGTPATAKPTKEAVKTAKPTAEVSAKPTLAPTEEPTAEPTVKPTAEPTTAPTEKPSAQPTEKPTAAPTEKPQATPADKPSKEPQLTMEPLTTPEQEPEESNEPAFIVPDDDSGNGLTGAQEIMIIVIAAICGIAFLVMLLLFLRVRKMR